MAITHKRYLESCRTHVEGRCSIDAEQLSPINTDNVSFLQSTWSYMRTCDFIGGIVIWLLGSLEMGGNHEDKIAVVVGHRSVLLAAYYTEIG